MKSNIEIKARAADFARQRETAEELCDAQPEEILQEDIFFNVPDGRLKLRIFDASAGELIFYRRDDTPGARRSAYWISETSNPRALADLLSAALGIRGVVKKRRHLYMYGRTRVHFDRVERLGDFIELEYVLEPDESDAEGKKTVQFLRERLGISNGELVDRAYIDLLEHRSGV